MKYLILMFLLLPMLLTGCTTDSTEPTEQQQLTIGLMPDINSIPFIIAEQLGYLDDSITLEIFMSAGDRDAALQTNVLDGAISDVLAVALARNGGFDMHIVGATQGQYGIVASLDSGITSIEDLAGSSIGLSTNTIIEYVTDSILMINNVDVSSIDKVAVPTIPSRLELLQNNQIDAIAVPEPHLFTASQTGTLISTSTDAGLHAGIFMLTGNAIEEKADLIEKLFEAYNKAAQFINENDKNEFLPDVIDRLGLPDTVLMMDLPYYTEMQIPETRQIDIAIGWLLNKELISEPFSFDDLVDARFVSR